MTIQGTVIDKRNLAKTEYVKQVETDLEAATGRIKTLETETIVALQGRIDELNVKTAEIETLKVKVLEIDGVRVIVDSMSGQIVNLEALTQQNSDNITKQQTHFIVNEANGAIEIRDLDGKTIFTANANDKSVQIGLESGVRIKAINGQVFIESNDGQFQALKVSTPQEAGTREDNILYLNRIDKILSFVEGNGSHMELLPHKAISLQSAKCTVYKGTSGGAQMGTEEINITPYTTLDTLSNMVTVEAWLQDKPELKAFLQNSNLVRGITIDVTYTVASEEAYMETGNITANDIRCNRINGAPTALGSTDDNENDYVIFNIWVNGGITDSGKGLYFTLPLPRPVKANSVRANGNVVVRQNGKYLYGGSWNAPIDVGLFNMTTGFTCTDGYGYSSAVKIHVKMNNNTNVMNNAPCSVVFTGTVTFQ